MKYIKKLNIDFDNWDNYFNKYQNKRKLLKII